MPKPLLLISTCTYDPWHRTNNHLECRRLDNHPPLLCLCATSSSAHHWINDPDLTAYQQCLGYAPQIPLQSQRANSVPHLLSSISTRCPMPTKYWTNRSAGMQKTIIMTAPISPRTLRILKKLRVKVRASTRHLLSAYEMTLESMLKPTGESALCISLYPLIYYITICN